MAKANRFPPYELLEGRGARDAHEKTKRLERLYHLTQKHSWDGKTVLAELLERHGAPGAGMPPDTRAALSRVLTLLMWGELAAWNISADLALEIPDVDAKMAATGQVFDEARHFYVLCDYVTALGPAPAIGGLPRRLLSKVLDAPTLATKLIGMQLLFETNAVVMFRRIAESGVCPILSELLPYFERDESRHVGLGVMYLPKLIQSMSSSEAARTARFQMECVLLLTAGGVTIAPDFETLGLDQRIMALRVTRMQDDIVQQMAEHHGRGILRAVRTPKAGWGPAILDWLHPAGGISATSAFNQRLHRGMRTTLNALDRALA
ncbi:MAG TPA: ferritin-like domain-containing protein [Polyangiaceae bacterium]|nr:ferritin-like domain-containing protein [Polyangiaceae bacterium]